MPLTAVISRLHSRDHFTTFMPVRRKTFTTFLLRAPSWTSELYQRPKLPPELVHAAIWHISCPPACSVLYVALSWANQHRGSPLVASIWQWLAGPPGWISAARVLLKSSPEAPFSTSFFFRNSKNLDNDYLFDIYRSVIYYFVMNASSAYTSLWDNMFNFRASFDVK